MASKTALWRKNLKENDPEKYEALKKSEKERSKLRREKRKQELQTRSTSEKAERERQLARDRSKRHYDKKTGKTSLRQRNSLLAARPESTKPPHPASKRSRDMTREEYLKHRREQRQKSRDNQNAKKKFWVRKKDKERKQRVRAEKRAATDNRATMSSASTPAAEQTSLTKTQYNYTSLLRKTLEKKAKTPFIFARMLKNLATKTRSPRKQRALKLEGNLSLHMYTKAEKAGSKTKARRRLFEKRKPRKDRLDETVKRRVKMFYMREDISRILPHKRYALKCGAGYVMQHTLLGAFRLFKEENPEVKLSYTLFTRLRPKQVRKISSTYLETCTCVHCINIQLKVLSLNRLSSRMQHPEKRVQNEVGLYKLLLCTRSPEEKFHHPACINGTCSACGDWRQTIFNHFSHLPPKEVLTWSRWSVVEKQSGKKTRRPVARSASVLDCLEELVKDVLEPTKQYTFIQHLHTAHWQSHQYRQLKETLQSSEVLLVQDFAENRKAAYQDEIKQAHFGKQQITLHPVVAFYCDDEGQTVRHAVNFVSDDTIHDHHAVHHFTAKTLQFLGDKGIVKEDTKVFIFSDGCASQYKGKGTFADLSLYKANIHRIYFGAEHGKGEADGETGVISKAVEAEVLCRKSFITDAEDFFSVCQKKLTKDEQQSKRDFFFVGPEDIVRGRKETDIQTLHGSRKLHEIVRAQDYVVSCRMLACLCLSCRDGNFSMCPNKERVGVFEKRHLTLAWGSVEGGDDDDSDGVGSDCERASDGDGGGGGCDCGENANGGGGERPDVFEGDGCDIDRLLFFQAWQVKLVNAKARSFDAFRAVAATCEAEAANKYPLSYNCQEPVFERARADMTAEALRPISAETDGRFALLVDADGNCLPRALAFAVFGNDTYHTELRIRIACELALNQVHYMSPDVIAKGTSLDGDASADFYQRTGDFVDASPYFAYQFEAMGTASNSTLMGPWQILAAANILQRPIFSVFPAFGSEVFKQELHRPFLPRNENARHHGIFIFWCSTRDDMASINPSLWTPNHFVPLVKEAGVHSMNSGFSESSVPRVGEFVSLTSSVGRRTITYHAVVVSAPPEVPLKEHEFYVQYMKKSGNFFVFLSEGVQYSIISTADTTVRILPPPTVDNRQHYIFQSPK